MTNPTKIFESDDEDSSASVSNKTLVSEDDDDIEQEDTVNDDFNSERVSRRKIISRDSQFVVEKTSRNSGFGSKDPLFHGVYLYEGTMTTEQVKKYGARFCNVNTNSKIENTNGSKIRNRFPERNRVSWSASFLNIFSSNN
jgi:hypothetical protein